jgi:hypothetical protein
LVSFQVRPDYTFYCISTFHVHIHVSPCEYFRILFVHIFVYVRTFLVSIWKYSEYLLLLNFPGHFRTLFRAYFHTHFIKIYVYFLQFCNVILEPAKLMLASFPNAPDLVDVCEDNQWYEIAGYTYFFI